MSGKIIFFQQTILSLLLYPAISAYWNAKTQSQVVAPAAKKPMPKQVPPKKRKLLVEDEEETEEVEDFDEEFDDFFEETDE